MSTIYYITTYYILIVLVIHTTYFIPSGYVYYIPEGDWPNHFSSLFLSADTFATVIEVPSYISHISS